MEEDDYNRMNGMKADWAREVWQKDLPQYAHVNWDRLYAVNKLNVEDGERRSKYALQERRVDQQDLNFAFNFKWRPSRIFTLTGGADAKVNRTEYYQCEGEPDRVLPEDGRPPRRRVLLQHGLLRRA